MSAARYRKKPVEVDAIRFIGSNIDEIDAFVGSPVPRRFVDDVPYPVIVTLEGEMFASVGDWIIRGVEGEYYPCKPSIFEATYEAVLA